MSTPTLTDLPEDPILERRKLVQATARRTLARRTVISRVMLAMCVVALVLALIPLVWLMVALVVKGLQWWSFTFFTKVPGVPTVFDQNNVGGIAPSIVGSLVIDTIAVLMAVPVGVIAGLLLAETDNFFTTSLRKTAEVMTGLPSILLGIFAYQFIVIRLHVGFAGIAGSFALAVLMIPVIMKASETALRTVPGHLKEAGLALGMRKSVVSRRIVVPTAMPGLVTAVLLATSRAVGETAPLLLVIGASNIVTWNPFKPMAALPLSIYIPFLNSPYPAQRLQAWGIALFLVVVVLLLNLGSRLLAAFIQRERR